MSLLGSSLPDRGLRRFADRARAVGRRRFAPAIGRRVLAGLTGILVTLAVLAMGVVPAAVAGDLDDETPAALGLADPSAGDLHAAVPKADREKVLPTGWKTSDDVAWAAVGDHHGFHVLTAPASLGYEWEVVASLAEPGFETDEWIGNACVTSSGRYAVVVYAPRSFVNDPDLFDRGGLAAIVDLPSGEVTKLEVTASLAYFNPGCGAEDLAVITAARADDQQGDTRLVTVDARSGTVRSKVTLSAQVTSAIPVSSSETLAATGPYVSRIDRDGRTHILAAAGSVPHSLVLDRVGGLVYLSSPLAATAETDRAGTSDHETGGAASPHGTAGDAASGQVIASRLTPAQLSEVPDRDSLPTGTEFARGALGKMGIIRSAHGGGALIGKAEVLGNLPVGMVSRPEVEHGLRVTGSTRGKVFVDKVGWKDDGAALADDGAAVTTKAEATEHGLGTFTDPELPRQVSLRMQVPATDATIELGTTLSGGGASTRDQDGASGTARAKRGATFASGTSLSPALGQVESAGMVSEPLPDGPERGCAVTRGDPRLQAMQPRPRQVEWAINQLIQGTLDEAFYPDGPDGWRTRVDMPRYTPSQLQPLPELAGPGTVADIPPQVLLGIAMSESNMQQAARSAVPGVTGNPLIGNYWGVTNDWEINFDAVDCGYGVMQVTDGMVLGQRPEGEQKAIALDYVANIQAGAKILIQKWNRTYNAGMTIMDGDPSYVENWFYALWAYNSGFYPEAGKEPNNGAWGLGWHNNPANAKYPPGRDPFLHDNDFDDGRTPNLWPYPERALGFAAWSSELVDGVGISEPGFRIARWTTELDRYNVKPPIAIFCDESNRCDGSLVGDVYTPPDTDEVPGPCYSQDDGVYDYHCWYHEPAAWKEDCATSSACGVGFIRFPGEWNGDENPYLDGEQTNDHSPAYDEEENQRSYPPNCSEFESETTNSAPPNAWIVDDISDGTDAVKPCNRSASDGAFTWRFQQAIDGTFPPKRDIHQIGAGWQGHFYFSHTRTGETGGIGDQLRAEGTWTLGHTYDGWMRIAVHLPDHGAHTQQARYDIDLDGDGAADRHRYINQRRMSNNWVSLGSYRVAGTPSVTLSNVTADGEGTQDVAWDAVAFQGIGSDKPVQVAVLGDSYASGEGTGFAAESGSAGYYPETNIGADLKGTSEKDWQNSCRRSPDAWGRKLTIPGVPASQSGEAMDGWSEDIELGFVACSGAKTFDLANVPWGLNPGWHDPLGNENPDSVGRPQYGEVRQLQSGVVNSDTDYVLLTIGGNDGDLFSSIIKECLATSQPTCVESETLAGAEELISDESNSTIGRTEELVQEIHQIAPDATIVIGTYPLLFASNDNRFFPGSSWCAETLIGTHESERITDIQLYYRESLLNSVAVMRGLAGIDVHVALVEGYFWLHDVCAVSELQWINGLVPLNNRQGDGDAVFSIPGMSFFSMASVHPNDLGTDAYAEAFSCALDRGIYDGDYACDTLELP